MKILGMSVVGPTIKSAFLEKYASLLSRKANRLPEYAKRQLIFAFILLSIAVLGGSLIQGLV